MMLSIIILIVVLFSMLLNSYVKRRKKRKHIDPIVECADKMDEYLQRKNERELKAMTDPELAQRRDEVEEEMQYQLQRIDAEMTRRFEQ